MSTKRVLIVERDDAVRLTIQHMLQARGHEVVAVEWPNAAFGPLAAQAFDIVFIARGANPFQPPHVLAWVIRATHPDVAIILMTGRGQVSQEPGPFDDVLLKPFSLDQILAAVGSLAPQWQAEPRTAAVLG
jgi:DNA-binding response OmpR family regulator